MIERVTRLSTGQLTLLLRLLKDAEAAAGRMPVDEQTVPGLAGPRDDAGVHLLLPADDALAGYAFLPAAPGIGELLVAPGRRGHGLGRELVRAALPASAGPALDLWSHGDHPAAAALAREFGFARVRELHQMSRPLTGADLPPAQLPPGVTVRPFVPGQDEAAWLRVNARAFATHPEQGRLTVADLRERMRGSWFDPAGFLLAERGGELVGFHWTKVHRRGPAGGPGPAGEVYVLGVDPSAADLRLGGPLAVLGLEYLRARGMPTAMLYVDGSNVRAMRLYERLGFTPSTTDVVYRFPT